MAEVQRKLICYQRSNILFFVLVRSRFGYGKINIAILIPKAPTQIVMSAVHGARTAFALNVLMAICGFYNLTAQLALNRVFL